MLTGGGRGGIVMEAIRRRAVPEQGRVLRGRDGPFVRHVRAERLGDAGPRLSRASTRSCAGISWTCSTGPVWVWARTGTTMMMGKTPADVSSSGNVRYEFGGRGHGSRAARRRRRGGDVLGRPGGAVRPRGGRRRAGLAHAPHDARQQGGQRRVLPVARPVHGRCTWCRAGRATTAGWRATRCPGAAASSRARRTRRPPRRCTMTVADGPGRERVRRVHGHGAAPGRAEGGVCPGLRGPARVARGRARRRAAERDARGRLLRRRDRAGALREARRRTRGAARGRGILSQPDHGHGVHPQPDRRVRARGRAREARAGRRARGVGVVRARREAVRGRGADAHAGLPGLLYARSRWGVWVLTTALSLLAKLRIVDLLVRLFPESSAGLKIPEYPELNLRSSWIPRTCECVGMALRLLRARGRILWERGRNYAQHRGTTIEDIRRTLVLFLGIRMMAWCYVYFLGRSSKQGENSSSEPFLSDYLRIKLAGATPNLVNWWLWNIICFANVKTIMNDRQCSLPYNSVDGQRQDKWTQCPISRQEVLPKPIQDAMRSNEPLCNAIPKTM